MKQIQAIRQHLRRRFRTTRHGACGVLCAALLLAAPQTVAQDDAAAPPAGSSLSSLRLETRLDVSSPLAMVEHHAVEPLPAQAPALDATAVEHAAAASGQDTDPVLKLGNSDAVAVQVYGRPEMSVTTYVADDGSISVPLAGAVHVAGLSPAQAADAVADALRQGQYLVNPQVTITLSQHRSQQISVLGEVRTPGRYALESRTNVIDLLAQAGGVTENGGDVIYVLRPRPGGGTERYPVDLKSLRDTAAPVPTMALKGGDSLFVPRADHFYIYGEVQQPNTYRLEPGMTVVQAISRSGGITPRGSDRRVVISRQTADGGHVTVDAHLFDAVRPDDVIRVKERIF